MTEKLRSSEVSLLGPMLARIGFSWARENDRKLSERVPGSRVGIISRKARDGTGRAMSRMHGYICGDDRMSLNCQECEA